MAEYHNQRQVMDHLDLKDYRTLRKWCREASPPIEPKPRPGYGPALWYTGTQLRKLEKVAEAHGRHVNRLATERQEEADDSASGALLSAEERSEDALLSSLLRRVETIEGRLDALELPEGETLASMIRREVQRQLELLPAGAPEQSQAQPRVSKVRMQQVSTKGS